MYLATRYNQICPILTRVLVHSHVVAFWVFYSYMTDYNGEMDKIDKVIILTRQPLKPLNAIWFQKKKNYLQIENAEDVEAMI